MVPAIYCRSRGSCAISDSTPFWNRPDAHVGCDTLLHFLLTSTFLRLTLPANRLSEEQFFPFESAAPPEANGYLPGSNPRAPEYKLATLVLTKRSYT